jgi:hypothetical protein
MTPPVGAIEDNAVLWLALSTVIGGILGAAVKFLFDDILRPAASLRRETRAVVRRYQAPLVRSAEALERRINILVRNEAEDWFVHDEYVRLSTLYALGEHLGWVRIIERRFGFLPFESLGEGRAFGRRINGIFRALSSHAYFRWHPDQAAVSESLVPRLMLTAVGEAMTVGGESPCVLEFTDFARRYVHDAQFRRWFAEAEELMAGAHPSQPLRWDRVIAAGAQLRALVTFLDAEGHMVRPSPAANLDLMTAHEVRAALADELGDVLVPTAPAAAAPAGGAAVEGRPLPGA